MQYLHSEKAWVILNYFDQTVEKWLHETFLTLNIMYWTDGLNWWHHIRHSFIRIFQPISISFEQYMKTKGITIIWRKVLLLETMGSAGSYIIRKDITFLLGEVKKQILSWLKSLRRYIVTPLNWREMLEIMCQNPKTLSLSICVFSCYQDGKYLFVNYYFFIDTVIYFADSSLIIWRSPAWIEDGV